jgi:hypothetical protein
MRARYYQQFDADYSRDIPGEGYGGWQTAEIEIEPEHTALVVMHAWDTGTYEAYPGWHRAVEYIPRAAEISRTVFPPLLSAVRRSRMPLFHVVGGGDYYKHLPGYQKAVELAGPAPAPLESVPTTPGLEHLRRFRSEKVFVGTDNREDTARGFARLDFTPEARPLDTEGVAENGHQLFALCREAGVNHLVYVGFALNWCLLLSPGGMAEMSRYGMLCSTIREATTAVENRETAREERCKEIALWRVALAFGFVFDLEDFLEGLA